MNTTSSGILYNNKTTLELKVLHASSPGALPFVCDERKHMEPGTWWKVGCFLLYISPTTPCARTTKERGLGTKQALMVGLQNFIMKMFVFNN